MMRARPCTHNGKRGLCAISPRTPVRLEQVTMSHVFFVLYSHPTIVSYQRADDFIIASAKQQKQKEIEQDLKRFRKLQ